MNKTTENQKLGSSVFLALVFISTVHGDTLTCLTGFGLAGTLGRLAPHGEPVLQQAQGSALLPSRRANFHHVGAPHHHTHVLVVQQTSKRTRTNRICVSSITLVFGYH